LVTLVRTEHFLRSSCSLSDDTPLLAPSDDDKAATESTPADKFSDLGTTTSEGPEQID
jgi:hypothetical protein